METEIQKEARLLRLELAEKRVGGTPHPLDDKIEAFLCLLISMKVLITSSHTSLITRELSPQPLTQCAAHADGECYHSKCPQLRDKEPQTSGRHCPIDNYDGGE